MTKKVYLILMCGATFLTGCIEETGSITGQISSIKEKTFFGMCPSIEATINFDLVTYKGILKRSAQLTIEDPKILEKATQSMNEKRIVQMNYVFDNFPVCKSDNSSNGHFITEIIELTPQELSNKQARDLDQSKYLKSHHRPTDALIM